ncbi:glycosyltransferase [Parendozoicomonas haliclonae]|uniref:glycosyltransferase n=1 Tax=Parendozoicomonas haliclonae TaxID=1960125 RepID=UPI0039F11797
MLQSIRHDYFRRELPSDFILFLGRLSSYKGVHILVKAIETLGDRLHLPVVIAGDGELFESILNALENDSLKKKIYFLGRFVNESEKYWLLTKCKFLIFPSIHRSEAFGLVQLESMSHGKPVINTKLDSGVPWVSLNGVTGITVTPNDTEELSEAIIELANNQKLRETYGKHARDRFNKMFSSSIAERNYQTLLNEVFHS